MNKSIWVIGVVAECEDCGKKFESYKNGQALAAKHAKHHGHKVTGEVVLAFEYDGRDQKDE